MRIILFLAVFTFSLVAQAQELATGREIAIFNAQLQPFSSQQATGFQSTFADIRGSSSIKTLNLANLPSQFQSTFPDSATKLQKVQDVCNKIRAKQGVLCSANFKIKAALTPNDPQYAQTWGMPKIGAPTAWDITTGSRSVKVAIVDTGIDLTNADLQANLSVNTGEIPGNGIDDDHNGFVDDVYGVNMVSVAFDTSGNAYAVDRTNNPQDDNNHGTHCAGTIGATGNNGVGVAGVNWSVGLIPVKALDKDGSGITSDIADGIRYAVDRGANVISMSLGGAGGATGDAMYQAILFANSRGVLIVAAAGNDGMSNDRAETGSGATLDGPSYPASYDLPNIIAVASTGTTDRLSTFSNYSATRVDLAAPGESILSTISNSVVANGSNKYAYFSGTSMATPHVAGAAALIKSAKSSLTMLQVKDLILNNVDIVSGLSGKVLTSGRLNVGKAVTAATGNILPPATPTPVVTTPPSSGNDGTSPSDGVDEPDPDVDDVPVIAASGKISAKRITINGEVFFSDSFEGISTQLAVVCSQARNTKVTSRSNGNFTVKLTLKKTMNSTKCKLSSAELGLTTRSFSVRTSKNKSVHK